MNDDEIPPDHDDPTTFKPWEWWVLRAVAVLSFAAGALGVMWGFYSGIFG